jgi:hypothetical protein
MNAPSTSVADSASAVPSRATSGQVLALVLSWTAVGLPLAWGVIETLRKTFALFQ